MADKIKLVVAVLLLCAGLIGFYVFSDQALVLRVVSVLLGVGLAVAAAWTTSVGQRAVAFAREAIAETKKVVWPTRKETTQMTGLVFVFVVVVAVFLWLTDKTLEWVFYDLILGWK